LPTPPTPPTPDDINATLIAGGRPVLPDDRAINLARALTQAVDERDVQEIGWRARDGWLHWDYGCWRAAAGR